jgi:hypothetical protein
MFSTLITINTSSKLIILICKSRRRIFKHLFQTTLLLLSFIIVVSYWYYFRASDKCITPSLNNMLFLCIKCLNEPYDILLFMVLTTTVDSTTIIFAILVVKSGTLCVKSITSEYNYTNDELCIYFCLNNNSILCSVLTSWERLLTKKGYAKDFKS